MTENIFLIAALVLGFYAAWNIGANDVANAMGTSVGSRALTIRQAVILAAIFEFAGAVLFGSEVSETLQKKIIDISFFEDQPLELARGMLAALLATGLWLQFASYCGLPVSTTHSIVGAIVGFGAVVVSFDVVYWKNVLFIALSWIGSPLMGAAVSFLVFQLLRRHIFYEPSPLRATKKLLPWIVAGVILVLSMVCVTKAIIPNYTFSERLAVSIIIAVAGAIITRVLIEKFKLPVIHEKHEVDRKILSKLDKAKKHLLDIQSELKDESNFRLNDILYNMNNFSQSLEHQNGKDALHTEFFWVEKIFGFLQISSACLMAFAHGSNDVSNAIGPMMAVISVIEDKAGSVFPIWALVLGGFGIVLGLATWGWRVIETIGRKITELTPSRGFSAEFGAALTILLASSAGFPVSTTHTLVGSVFGVGFAGGLSSLNLKTVKDIIFSWIVTIPAGALLSILSYHILSFIL